MRQKTKYNELRMDWDGLILLVSSALFVKKICLKAERERDGLLDLFSRQLR